ncbi:chorion class high-cysteine HCB protein 13-like [Cydia strobilella]|uniref:chorion class high-cysteine HCB protein 13-like n=1 Tax=Cydia strobilella TaxID=1100964 RepID=UPI003004B377
MAFKVVILCAFALLIQSISGKSCGCSCGSGRSGKYISSGSIGSVSSSSSGSIGSVSSSSSISSKSISVSNSGGDFLVTCVGPISPSGIAVSSELGLSGDLNVNGELPFLSAVEFSGQYDTKGSGCVDYSCGTCGNVAITSVQGSSGCGCGCGR